MKSIGKMIPELLGQMVSKPDTVMYPYEHKKVQDRFRGKLKFDPEKCIGCKMCERNCPSDAIEITKVGEKQFKASVYLDRCIYCGQCVDTCPKKALENTEAFELASFNRDSLKTDI
jgi:formate hydrogenlyase subunit 6/NADH:ubiquinone oxidoreductase subunit I